MNGSWQVSRATRTEIADESAVGDEQAIRAAQMNPAAFSLLYERYVDAVYGYCLIRLGNPMDAEDAAALVFQRAFEAASRFKSGQGSVRAWLFAIAHNTVANAHRGRRPHRPIEDAARVADGQPSPDDQAIRAEERARLQFALSRLTGDQRSVIELRMAGLSSAEVAQAMNKSVAAVKMLQLRAIDRLQELMHAPGNEKGDRR